jgi:nitrite reductase/ring-hydroxylating ferredoxin subunit
MNAIDRRQFVAAGVACACAGCPALRAFPEAAAGSAASLDVGPLDDFRASGIHDPLGRGRRFFLVNRGGRLFAVSATCTHRRVKLVTKGGSFKCPRHGSTFTAEGKVTRAPARRSLPRYGIRVTRQGRVVVDPSRVFAQDAWDEAAAFVAVDRAGTDEKAG